MKNFIKIFSSYLAILFVLTACQQDKVAPPIESEFVLSMPDDEQFTKLSIALLSAAQLEGVVEPGGRTSSVYYPPSSQTISPSNYEAGFVQSGVNQFGESFRQDWTNFKAIPGILQTTNNFEYSDGYSLVSKMINTSSASSAVKSQLSSFSSQLKTLYDQLVANEVVNPYLSESYVQSAYDSKLAELAQQASSNSALTQSEKNAIASDIQHAKSNISTYRGTVSQINTQQIAAGGRLEAAGRIQKTKFGKFLVKFGNFVTTVVVITTLAILVAASAPTGTTAATINIFNTAGYAAVLAVRGLFRPWNMQYWWT